MTPENKMKAAIKRTIKLMNHRDTPYISITAIAGGVYGTNGVSDFILCTQGLFIGMEVKTATGKLSVLQARFLDDINKAGGLGLVIYDRGNAIGVMEELLAHIAQGGDLADVKAGDIYTTPLRIKATEGYEVYQVRAHTNL